MKKDKKLANLIDGFVEKERPREELLSRAVFELRQKNYVHDVQAFNDFTSGKPQPKPKATKAKKLRLGFSMAAILVVVALSVYFFVPWGTGGSGDTGGNNDPTPNPPTISWDSADYAPTYYGMNNLTYKNVSFSEAKALATANGATLPEFLETEENVRVKASAYYKKGTTELAFMQILLRRENELGGIDDVRMFIEFSDEVFEAFKDIYEIEATPYDGNLSTQDDAGSASDDSALSADDAKLLMVRISSTTIAAEKVTVAAVAHGGQRYYFVTTGSDASSADFYIKSVVS